MNRRQWLGLTAGASAALALDPRLLSALRTQELISRAVPSTGQRVPVIGLGSSATFAQVARSEDYSALRDVLRTMTERGGTVFDTAPGYGASEQVAGDIAAELGITDRVFWATKMNVAQGPGASADPARARQQIETSFSRLRKRPIDLIQVHGPIDIPTQLGVLKEQKRAGSIRYIGVTSTSKPQYEEKQSGNRIETESHVNTPAGEQRIADVYVLDGAETEFQPVLNVQASPQGEMVTTRVFTRQNRAAA